MRDEQHQQIALQVNRTTLQWSLIEIYRVVPKHGGFLYADTLHARIAMLCRFDHTGDATYIDKLVYNDVSNP